AEELSVDALIAPSFQLGLLAERGLVAPVPKDMLRGSTATGSASEDRPAEWSDVFELPKLREAAWETDVMGLTFGSPVFTLYYRADLLEELGHQPPETWEEYKKLAVLLADAGDASDAGGDGQSWYGTIEPLAPGWAGLVLLARAAPYAKHRDNYSTLFDISTMEPLIAGPPFVWALEALVAATEPGGREMLRYDPASAREAVWQGRCGMALTWPSAAAEISESKALQIGIAELPGSNDVYDVGSQSKERRTEDEDRRVPLLAIAGRIGLVSKASSHREHAFQLLAWLSSERLGAQVCSGSPATTLFRRSHENAPGEWVESCMSVPTAKAYAELTETTFLRQQWLFALRIAGRDEYLAALDEAVRRAVSKECTAEEALDAAADQWRAITERLGREQQKTAYRHSLGLP
ncbi:MAG TPA: extracellular solute-binding protein, partial [Thermoguttaceae bacterium]|nr:extracellular solute-binding protein [Thermoguttaceae bacterium]